MNMKEIAANVHRLLVDSGAIPAKTSNTRAIGPGMHVQRRPQNGNVKVVMLKDGGHQGLLPVYRASLYEGWAATIRQLYPGLEIRAYSDGVYIYVA
jgi:hypothetical protein